MSLDLVNPAPFPSPKESLRISQRAPQTIESTSKSYPWPLSLLTTTETPETWQSFETLYLSCMRTGDDASAKQLLDRLVARFGDKSEKVMAYQAMYSEARASNEKELLAVLKEIGSALEADPTNLPMQKRRIVLLKSMGKLPEATQMLVNLVEYSPVDAEAWAELADLYIMQGLWDQAIYCLEEVLLIVPNAWTMHARLAEVIYMTANASNSAQSELARFLAESMRRYCRSVELCSNFLRGYYGLVLTTQRLKEVLPTTGKSKDDSSASDLPLPSLVTVERLHEVAVKKLAEIVRSSTGNTDGLDEAELIGAKELLNRIGASVQR